MGRVGLWDVGGARAAGLLGGAWGAPGGGSAGCSDVAQVPT